MRLEQYRKLARAKSLRKLSRESGVSYITVKAVAQGKLLNNYNKALALSEATRPEPGEPPLVTVADLCEERKKGK